MTEIAFLPEDAKQRWRDLTHAMTVMGLGHLARLYGQLEGYIMALLDFEQITAPQGKQLLKAAADLFGHCRSEYLKHKQKPRRHIAGAVAERVRRSQGKRPLLGQAFLYQADAGPPLRL